MESLGLTLTMIHYIISSILLISSGGSQFTESYSNTAIELQEFDLNAFCGHQKTCGDCLAASAMCCWCSDCQYNKEFSGCNLFKRLKFTGCHPESIKCRKHSTVSKQKDDQYTDVTSTESKPVQIKPQRLTIELSLLDEQSISFKYMPAKDYPLDLYYLMDLTWSMRDDKETLVGLRDQLPIFLGNLTKNFMLGFGSFADKPLMHCIQSDKLHRENPCKTAVGNCELTYSYRHRLNMTQNVEDFVSTVRNSQMTANLDNVVSGLDALMQVLVCKERVGWNQSSRKIVIFATDGTLHFSGDGILGGAIKPNDKKCHLDIHGEYTEATTMDYPSLEQIYRVLLVHRVSIIFAVTKAVMPYYENIRELFPDDVFVAELSDNSSNILSLVKQGYQRFSSVINFQDDADEMFRIKYFSDCGVKNRPLVETSKCEDIVIGKEYTFLANITLKQCPKNRNLNHKITILEERLGQDKLVLDVTANCGCDCEEQNCACGNNSKLECGKCVCLDGWFGRDCDCFEKEGLSKDTSNCKKPDEIKVCSGVGDCVCEICHCDLGYFGAFCECKECPVSADNGQTCGGISRGTCACGVCACQESWFGPTCSCSRSNTHCIALWETKECSGRGTCNCGECRCHRSNEKMYTGKYCETCVDCENPACSVFEDCVRCTIGHSCNESTCLSKDGTLYKPVIINEHFEDTGKIDHCILREEACERIYTYTIQNDRTVVLNIYLQKCQNGVLGSTAGLVFSIVVLTLFVGAIGIISYKCYKNKAYKGEYRKLVAESKKQMETSNVYTNPLYKSPTFEVPREEIP